MYYSRRLINSITCLKLNSIKEKIYYWSPFLSPIATSKAVINSAASLMKYSSKYESNILNFFGEFDESKQLINEKKN